MSKNYQDYNAEEQHNMEYFMTMNIGMKIILVRIHVVISVRPSHITCYVLA